MARIVFVDGPMFAGKTEHLIAEAAKLSAGGERFLVFKPALDSRFERNAICSHDGYSFKAIVVDGPQRLFSKTLQNRRPVPRTVIVDEVQFFQPAELMVATVAYLSTKMPAIETIILAGLTRDFRGEPFGAAPQLKEMADQVIELTAKCAVCGGPATRSQRLIDGRPASWFYPVVLVGGQKEGYEPRCVAHHQVRYRRIGKLLKMAGL